MTIEDEYTLIIVDVPIRKSGTISLLRRPFHRDYPDKKRLLSRLAWRNCRFSISLISRRLRNFYTFYAVAFIFQILYRNAELHLSALRTLDRKSEQIRKSIAQINAKSWLNWWSWKKPSSTLRPLWKPSQARDQEIWPVLLVTSRNT